MWTSREPVNPDDSFLDRCHASGSPFQFLVMSSDSKAKKRVSLDHGESTVGMSDTMKATRGSLGQISLCCVGCHVH